MNKNQYSEKILNALKLLSLEKIAEVSDFIQFLLMKAKREKELLETTGLSLEEAANLKFRLATFEEDWNDSKMDLYDEL